MLIVSRRRCIKSIFSAGVSAEGNFEFPKDCLEPSLFLDAALYRQSSFATPRLPSAPTRQTPPRLCHSRTGTSPPSINFSTRLQSISNLIITHDATSKLQLITSLCRCDQTCVRPCYLTLIIAFPEWVLVTVFLPCHLLGSKSPCLLWPVQMVSHKWRSCDVETETAPHVLPQLPASCSGIIWACKDAFRSVEIGKSLLPVPESRSDDCRPIRHSFEEAFIDGDFRADYWQVFKWIAIKSGRGHVHFEFKESESKCGNSRNLRVNAVKASQ